MKNLFKYILCLSAFAGDVQSLLAQNIDVFFFAPTATMNANFTGATAAYINPDSCGAKPNRTATGYSSVRLDNQTAPIFRTLMAGSNIQKTYDSLTNAASKLRRRILQIRGLSNGLVNDVEIYLFNDNSGLAATDNCKCSHPIPAGRGVWACASNFKRSNGQYLGYVYLGESAATAIIAPHRGGWWAWNGTVIHEFSHTQFAMEYDATGKPISNKWGFNGLAISYGGDESHWGDELQADQQSALDEGLATFWGLESNAVVRDTLVNWLNRKNRRLVLGSHSFLTGIAEMWDAPHGVILNTTIPADRKIQRPGYNTSLLVNPNIQTGARYELRDYRWLDVPGKFEFYNEQIFQGYALLFFENAMRNRNNSFAMMLRAAQKMTPPNNKFRYPAVLANALAIELEAY